jgi:hypothetical protein
MGGLAIGLASTFGLFLFSARKQDPQTVLQYPADR